MEEVEDRIVLVSGSRGEDDHRVTWVYLLRQDTPVSLALTPKPQRKTQITLTLLHRFRYTLE